MGPRFGVLLYSAVSLVSEQKHFGQLFVCSCLCSISTLETMSVELSMIHVMTELSIHLDA